MLFSLKNKLKAEKQNTSFNNFAMFAQLSWDQLGKFGLYLYFAVIALCLAIYLARLSSQRKQVIDEAVKIKERSANLSKVQCNLLRNLLYQQTNFVALGFTSYSFLFGIMASCLDGKIAKCMGFTTVIMYFSLNVAVEINKIAFENLLHFIEPETRLEFT